MKNSEMVWNILCDAKHYERCVTELELGKMEEKMCGLWKVVLMLGHLEREK